MKQKELLLWVVAIAALALSLIAVIGPKGLESDAAMRPYTMQVESANPTASGIPVTLNECIQIAERAYQACSSLQSRCFSTYLQAEKQCKSLFAPSN